MDFAWELVWYIIPAKSSLRKDAFYANSRLVSTWLVVSFQTFTVEGTCPSLLSYMIRQLPRGRANFRLRGNGACDLFMCARQDFVELRKTYSLVTSRQNLHKRIEWLSNSRSQQNVRLRPVTRVEPCGCGCSLDSHNSSTYM